MAISGDYLVYIEDLLADIPGLRSKRMFGGAGLYGNGLFFAIIVDDTLYFKVDDRNRGDYEKLGAQPFRYLIKGQQRTMSYYAVPAEIIESPEALMAWAERALDAALRARTHGAASRDRPQAP